MLYFVEEIMTKRLTKCDFIRATQCPKMLWLDRHKPERKVIPAEVQARLDRGNAFGDRAMGMFGDYVEMTAYNDDGRIDCEAMIGRTRQEIAKGTPVLCEAAFEHDGLYCAVDILRRESDCYSIYEVKDAIKVEGQFVMDVTFQYFVASHYVKIKKAYIVTHRADDTYEEHDVTRLVYLGLKLVQQLTDAAKRAALALAEPPILCGEHCAKPYRCWYWDYCHKI